MRISDWSSDVCSSDLYLARLAGGAARVQGSRQARRGGKALPRLWRGRALGADAHQGLLLGRPRGAGGGRPRRRERAFSRCGAALRSILRPAVDRRSEEHTSELQSLMRISYAVFCLKKKIRSTYITYRMIL